MSPRNRRRQPPAPIPAKVKQWLQAGILAIILTAAVGNIGHTFAHVDDSGQHGWYAAAMSVTPDVGVLIGVTLLTFRRRSFWGWLIITASAAFVSWSAFSVAGSPWQDKVVALAPVAFAAIGAGLLESIRGESWELILAHAEALTEDAWKDANALAMSLRADIAARIEAADSQAATAAREAAAAVESEAVMTERASALSIQVSELTARLAEAMSERKDIESPTRRVSAAVKPQVRADVPDGLSDAETDVLMSMLGQGEMTRADIITGSRRVESTVKAALRRLSDLGYVVSEQRGIYRTVTPGVDGQPSSATAADGPGIGVIR